MRAQINLLSILWHSYIHRFFITLSHMSVVHTITVFWSRETITFTAIVYSTRFAILFSIDRYGFDKISRHILIGTMHADYLQLHQSTSKQIMAWSKLKNDDVISPHSCLVFQYWVNDLNRVIQIVGFIDAIWSSGILPVLCCLCGAILNITKHFFTFQMFVWFFWIRLLLSSYLWTFLH